MPKHDLFSDEKTSCPVKGPCVSREELEAKLRATVARNARRYDEGDGAKTTDGMLFLRKHEEKNDVPVQPGHAQGS